MSTKTGKKLEKLARSLDQASRVSEESTDELLSEQALVDGALNVAADAFIVFDLKGKPIKWNKVVTEFTGYSDEEFSSLKITDLVAEEYRQQVGNTFKAVLKEGRATVDAEVITKTGDRVPLEFTGAVLKDKKDKPVGICAIGRNITERKRAEEELALSERKFRTIFDNASDAIFIHDLSGRILEVNQVAVERLGYPREQLLSMTPMDFDSPEFAEMVPPRIKALQETGAAIFETAQVTKDGKVIPTEASSRVIEFQGQDCIFTIARDITERKRKEKELSDAEERWEKSFQTVGEGMFIIDKDLNILQHNRAFAELLGRKPEDITGQKCHELVHGLKQPPDFCATCAAIKEQRSIKAELYEPYLGKHLAVSADPAFDSKGNFEFAVHIIRDVTERNAFEEERNGLIHKLGERVKELRALHELSRLIEKTGTTLPEILEGTAQLIPPAWQYPEVTCARLTLGGEEFKSKNFRKTEWSQSSDITVHGMREGTVEVYYLEERPEAEDGPFLSEERILLEVLAERLGRVVERVRVEEALRDERDFIDIVIDALPDGFYVLSVAEQGKFIRWNKGLCDVTGYSDDELSSMTIFDLFDEEGKKRQQEFLLELLEKGQASIEIDVVIKDGRRIPYHARSTLLRDAQGNPLYVCGVARDMTERKRAEEELRASESKFRFMTENMNDVAWAIDLNMNTTYTSPLIKKVLGFTPEERMIQQVQEQLTPESFELASKTLIEELQRDKDEGVSPNRTVVLELDFLHKDGHIVSLEAIMSFIRDQNDSPAGIYGLSRDITERKLAEERLREALNELARSNAELEQFAYSASHDLQEPLRMVSSYVQLLERRYKDKLDSDADDFIGFAVDGVHRMQNLISDLLEYSRVGMRGKPLRPTEAGTALDHALSNLEVAIKESGAVITRDDLPTVMADETQLIQLFQNLIGNAINFRGDDKPSIHISAGRRPNEFLFSVRDNGIGIDPGQYERIFQIFQRLHTKSEHSGTGIGLAVCKRIVERHGGLIWVESEPGSGSTFFFTLPTTVREEQ
jgi:PAS domain S-box-containing protein